MNEYDKLLLEFNERYARSLHEANQLRGQLVVVPGAGAVGSFVTAHLAHHGCDVTTIDGDRLESANQARHYLSDPRYLGQPKAAALATQLRREVPALQKVRSLVADIRQLTREQMADLFKDARLIIAATGRDDIDRVLDLWARHFGIPILFPSLWAGEHAILGDLHLVAWNMPDRRGACFACVRPVREGEPPPAEAQPGTGADVLRVAGFTTEVALALLTENPNRPPLLRNVQRGATYFLIPRWPPSLRAVVTRPRRGCPTCVGIATATERVSGFVSPPTRDWVIGGSLVSAILGHQFIPGFDAAAPIAFITAIGLWWRGQLPSFVQTTAWLRSHFG